MIASLIKQFHHVKLDVQDLEKSIEFYCNVLEFIEIVRYHVSEDHIIVQVSSTGQPPGIELWYEKPYKGLNNDRLHLALEVRNTTLLVERLRHLGVFIEREPFQIGSEIIAVIRDPDNYLIELNQNIGIS